jgi:predicted lipoprotein with Yx(FWY)xxD motif
LPEDRRSLVVTKEFAMHDPATVGRIDPRPMTPPGSPGEAPARSIGKLERLAWCAGGLAALSLVLASCGADPGAQTGDPYGAAPPATTSAPSANASSAPSTGTSAGGGATVALGKSSLGQILLDDQGRTLYLFEADKGGSSACYGGCAKAWPPLLTTAAPVGTAGVTQNLLGTTKRQDGTMEVTYGGHPLYYFIGDNKPGDVTGQDIDQFGAEWYVLGPDGKKVDAN